MGTVKRYFSHEFQRKMFGMGHVSASDFYLSPWQRNRSAFPLLLLRCILFFGSLGIVLSTIILTSFDGSLPYWPIYLTNWGVVLLPITCGLGLAVSCRAYFYGPTVFLDSSLDLPWYIKLYWVSTNVAVPIAFLITVFYWTLLTDLEAWGVDEENLIEFAPNAVLDVFIHGINSVIVFLLLMTSRQPFRLLHAYMPLAFALIYGLFAGIYYLAGGQDGFGNSFIYPMIDWAYPGPTTIVLLLILVLFLILHVVVVVMVLIRDALARRCMGDSETLTISNNKY